MWIVVIVAVGTTIVRGGPEAGMLAHVWLLLVIGSGVVSWVWFVVIPQKSLKLAKGDVDRQRRLLQWVVNTPGVQGMKIHARYILAANLQVAKRYAEAEALFQLIVKVNQGALEPGFESLLRQKLADTIEALGRGDEAEAERERASEILPGAGKTVLSHQAQGKLFDSAHRYAEAVTAYERALSFAPLGNNSVRTTLMMQLVVSTNNAGRPAATVRWAEAVIALDPHCQLIDGVRRMAALGYMNLGQLDDAERHLRVAIEHPASPKNRAESLALLAACMMRRGDLDKAERICRDAEDLAPGTHPLWWKMIARIEKARGRLEEAIRALEHANTPSISHIPAQHRHTAAVIKRELATLHSELGRGDIALALICEAELELAGDPKQEILVNADAAFVHASRCERDLARQKIASAYEGRKRMTIDRSSEQAMLISLSRASLLIDEPRCAQSFLDEFLKLRPDPGSYPFTFFHLAECRRQIGDEAGARELYIKAASTHFGSRWERLARERLTAETSVRS
jgi:tetratricopeptide (TPR) repeat protein